MMFHNARLPALMTAVLLGGLLPQPGQAASVLYDDGLVHTIPGDPAFAAFDWIRLENGSGLVVSTNAQVFGAFASSGSAAFAGTGLTTTPGTSARMTGGEIAGGDAEGILDETTPTNGFLVVGGDGIDLASAGPGGLTGLSVRNGWIRGGSANGVADATIDDVETQGGAALVFDGGRTTVESGLLESGDATCSGASGLNFATSGDLAILLPGSVLQAHGGSFLTGFAAVDHAAFPAGDALAIGGDALDVRDDATVVVHEGFFEGGAARADAGFGSGSARAFPGASLRVDDGARVAIYGGNFVAGAATGSANAGPLVLAPAPALRFDVGGSPNPTRLTILGGTFRGDTSLEIPFTNATPPPGPVWDGAVVWIVGGDFDSAGDVDLRLSHPGVMTILLATSATVNGNPITGPLPTTGTIAGVLAMGPAFELTYALQNGAVLGVPEPTSGALAGFVALGALARRRRKCPR